MANETFPTPTDSAYIQRLRNDYPEICEGRSDEEVVEYYNPQGFKYVECTLWDHVGDAANDFERLADEYLKLKAGTARLPGRCHAPLVEGIPLTKLSLSELLKPWREMGAPVIAYIDGRRVEISLADLWDRVFDAPKTCSADEPTGPT